MVGTKRAGLEVVKNTLRDDWNRDAYDGMGPATFNGVLGVVEILVTEDCLLTDSIKLEVAELMAQDEAADTLPHHIEVTKWQSKVEGHTIKFRVADAADVDPDTRLAVSRSDEFAMRQRPSEGW